MNDDSRSGRNRTNRSSYQTLIDVRRANDVEGMLTDIIRMPIPDIMAAALTLDESVLNAKRVENLIKSCPTMDEMDLLKKYAGDKQNLGMCEQLFLEMMKVPRVKSKLQVFLFKIQFNSQITDLTKKLATVNVTCEEVRNSIKLQDMMKKILILSNTFNQGTPRGQAIGVKLEGFLKLSETRSTNNRMTLMHYLCHHVATKTPELVDFHKDLENLEAASKINLKSLVEEMQALNKGLEMAQQELAASENDGPVSEAFRKSLKTFIGVAEPEVKSMSDFYSIVRKNADALLRYFGEDPALFAFEQVTQTLLKFTIIFRQAHDDNLKQAELGRLEGRTTIVGEIHQP